MHGHDPLACPSTMANHSSQCGDSMSKFVHTPNHTYTVELRFYGDSLEPSEITRRLSLQPSCASGGLTTSPNGRKVRPFWGYDGQGEDGFQAEWQSLEQGLEFVLRRITPLKATVIELSQDFEGIWWCGHFQTGFDGGPMLSPKILAETAGYGIPLFIDNYFAPKE